jgi:excinuclease ABC subunit C
MQAEMMQAAEELKFERAATLRDQINAIDRVVERQKVITTEQMDSDVIAMARTNGEACVQIFFIRGGKLIGREYFILEGAQDEADGEVVAEFIKQFYMEAAFVPPQVLLPNEVEEARVIQEWLHTSRSAQKVELVVPHSGTGQELVQMATENAVETLRALKAQWEADTNRQTQALAELQQAFGLSEPPNRIECYDISNTQGTASVGSMVVFEQGVPSKKLYRRFNIETVNGPDDFASMEEVLTRRLRRWQAAQEQEADAPGRKPDASFDLLPDVLIVDGGKGQLGRAVKVIEQFGLTGRFVVAGLAKENEELFFPGRSESLVLPRHSQGLYLLQRIRDEAHRFGITAHRKRRTREGMASRLDKIKGVGKTRRNMLLKKFGSLDAIQQASLEELTALPGITEEIALALKGELD